MSSLNLFEAFSKPATLIGGRASATQEKRIEPIRVVETPRHSGRDYAREYIKKEQENYESYHASKPPLSEEGRHRSNVSDAETSTNYVSEMTNDDQLVKLKVFDEQNFDVKKTPADLPILAEKDEIIRMIESYRAVIIQGNTGCGKTTQVPQFILDHYRERKQSVNIIVTQPRRIAAISISKRVCMERGWKEGTVVGYQIGQDRKTINDNTLITYCTTGVLLQKLIAQRSLNEYTHIILDEVHERDSEMDFLLILVRKYANTNSRNVKVILMSATLNTDTFSEYFYVTHGKEKISAPVHKIRDKSQHQVRIFYLNDLSNISEAKDMVPEGDNPEIKKKGYITAMKVIKALDQLEKNTAEKKKTKVEVGAVLVFLPGLYEIEEIKKQLDQCSSDVNKWWIVPLHSSITKDEQDRVFLNAPENHRKIVLSTNIAESSITIKDIKYVIDFCLTKVIVTDPQTNLAALQLCWTSKNSLIQRAGRAGRVGDGRVYRLIEKEFYSKLDDETTPEMLRCPLDQLVLQVKILDIGPPAAIFALAMNQPDLRNIEQTVLSLKEIGALTVTTDVGRSRGSSSAYIDDLDGELTHLGQMIAKLPMDVRLGKLIFFGDLFNVLEECIIMACAMSVKNMFSSPFQKYLRAYNSKLDWAGSSCSDCIAYFTAYRVWRRKKADGVFKVEKHEEDWCRERFLQLKILKEISVLFADVKQRLGVKFEEKPERKVLNGMDKNLFIKLALAAAFYPNYFLRGSHSGKVDEKLAVATLSGHDPYTTVYLQGMPNNQHGILYKKTIEKQFEEVSSRVNIHFDHGSKVLINFGHYAAESTPGGERQSMMIPGKIDLSVYRAVKLRQLKSEIRIPVFNAAEAEIRIQNYLKQYEQLNSKRPNGMKLLPWPWDKSLDTRSLPIFDLRITHVESPTRFWARSPSSLVAQQYHEICEFLNGPGGVCPIPRDENIKVGDVYACTLIVEGTEGYFRCRIESYKYFNNSYGIYFIDVGEGRTGVKRQDLRAITHLQQNHFDEIPDLATEFSLVKIEPPRKYEGKWHTRAIQLLENFKRVKDHNSVLWAETYSVVNNVVKVKLFQRSISQTGSLKAAKTVTEDLVKRGWADKTEEPFLSKQDHEERKIIHKLFEQGEARCSFTKNLTEKEELIEKLNALDIDEPTRSECRHEVVLKGPFSPLEMRIFSVTKCSMPKLAIIEKNSVNSVLLDTNPSDEFERMIIASYVGINSSRDKLSLRDTTVMPSLPGLPALICLLFSPMVEMRCDPDFTRFTGALCGLGYEKDTKRPLNGDNDMEIVFDVEITLEVLVEINRIRYWLNRFFAKVPQATSMKPDEKADGYRKLHDYIYKLVWNKWEPEELHYTTEAHQWGKIPKERLMNPCNDELSEYHEPSEDLDSVYRLIWGINLTGDISKRREVIKNNLKSLHEFSLGKLFVKEVECKLCQIVLANRTNARLHLKSSLHKARASKYLEDDDTTYDSRSEATGYDNC